MPSNEMKAFQGNVSAVYPGKRLARQTSPQQSKRFRGKKSLSPCAEVFFHEKKMELLRGLPWTSD